METGRMSAISSYYPPKRTLILEFSGLEARGAAVCGTDACALSNCACFLLCSFRLSLALEIVPPPPGPTKKRRMRIENEEDRCLY
jgi:hypothetical protein